MEVNKVSNLNFGQIYDFAEARKYMVRRKKELPEKEQLAYQDKVDSILGSQFMDVYVELNAEVYAKNKFTGKKYETYNGDVFERFNQALDIACKLENQLR